MSRPLPTKTSLRFRGAILALTASTLLAAFGLPATARSDKSTQLSDQERDYRAAYAYRSSERCVAANGAQIMGGFAGPDDKLDTVTGEICSR
ncbi:hypothetical protein GGD83_004300 [Rhodoblastus sphagnicola]|nr:hypothetical protein [Rhodoblastus sphagnicola]MBB4200471.1 hypothetical protein [Rhodoblastus sphagnicola]